jgi:hypothetical protein
VRTATDAARKDIILVPQTALNNPCLGSLSGLISQFKLDWTGLPVFCWMITARSLTRPAKQMREDPMVISDSQILPGFNAIRTTPSNSVVFENDRRKLTVLITNRQPLEEQLGVDLIYYNETFRSFLMIQYKAMEQEAFEAVYHLPHIPYPAVHPVQSYRRRMFDCWKPIP